jgi:hypothetical protein
MPGIPIYLKTVDAPSRPEDPEFYWLTRSGLYFCRNQRFFSSDAPARRMPGTLAEHQPGCEVRLPLLGVAALEYVVGFFHEIYLRHGAEAIVLLLWDLRRKRYRLCVPPQRASVWKSTAGLPCAVDVAYEIPTPLPRDHLLIGDIHSHADLQAYSSGTDAHDERYRDGVHVVVGQIDREPPDFHLDMVVDGARFPLRFGQFFRGYRARRVRVPRAWPAAVKVGVSYSTWVSTLDVHANQRRPVANQVLSRPPKPAKPRWNDGA